MAMELLHQQDGKPSYLTDLDFSNTSPASAQHISNLSSYQNPLFDQLEYSNLHNPPFAHTPSYHGSYHNSPYSVHSELSFGAENDQFGAAFDDDSNLAQLNGALREDYDPSEYDPPNTGGLLMFDSDFMSGNDGGSPQVSVSVTPAPIDYSSPHAYDHSSPSSNGGGDSVADGQARSRGSSVSSNPYNNQMSSPRLDMTHGFENMRFESPNWGTRPLSLDRSVSPPHKPQSPPQLVIPDSGSPNMYAQSPPLINAPDGDGGLMGPSLHIVPATPVTGAGGASQAAAYQNNLETLQQGMIFFGTCSRFKTMLIRLILGSVSGPSNWRQADASHMAGGQYSEAQLSFNFPGHSHNGDPRGLSTGNTQIQHAEGTDFLFPISNPRSRRKSDTDLRPPLWGIMSQEQINNSTGGSAYDDGEGTTVNLSDILPTPQHPSHLQYSSSFSNGNGNGNGNMHPPLLHHTTFGPPATTNSNYLSPDIMAAHLRRSKSDSGSRPGHQRQSRSEDMRHSNALLYPPSSQQDFITRQFLHPQESLPMPIRNGPSHHRRASSGSRAEAVGGSWSGASSARPSPYPSPHASPRYNIDELPSIGLSGRQPPMLQHEVQDIHELSGGGPPLLRMDPRSLDPVGGIVSKPNVTTGRTANASRIRRKQDANFMCPVPGCGSTFTRSFNLKGMSYALWFGY